MPIWCRRLTIHWVAKSVHSGFVLLISYVISPPWYNWNTIALARVFQLYQQTNKLTNKQTNDNNKKLTKNLMLVTLHAVTLTLTVTFAACRWTYSWSPRSSFRRSTTSASCRCCVTTRRVVARASRTTACTRCCRSTWSRTRLSGRWRSATQTRGYHDTALFIL